MIKFLVVLILLFTPSTRGRGKGTRVSHDIPWDPRTTYGLQFGQVHTVDVLVDEYMDIYCPQYDADASSTMKFIIYNVSQKSFDECSMAADAKRIFECDSPSISKKLTTKFQRRSPNPMGFIFKPGHSYYYMSFVNVQNEKYSCDKALRMAINVHHKSAHSHTKASLPATRSAPPRAPPTTTSKPTTTTKAIRITKSVSSKTSAKTSTISRTKTSTKLDEIRDPQQREGPGGSAASLTCSNLWFIFAFFLAISFYT